MTKALLALAWLAMWHSVTAAASATVVYLERVSTPPPNGFARFEVAFRELVGKRYKDVRLVRQPVRIGDKGQLVEDLGASLPPPGGVLITAETSIAQAIASRWPEIPLVLVTLADPRDLGLVDAKGRAKANVTGFTYYSPFEAKHLEILREVAPQAKRVGVVADRYWIREPLSQRLVANSPRTLGLWLTVFSFEGEADIANLAGADARAIDAWLVPDTPANRVHGPAIAAAIAKLGTPSIGGHASHFQGGGLMVYEPKDVDGFRRAAETVATVLSGVQPRHIAFDSPRAFGLVIDIRVARRLGVRIPPDLLKRADRVVQ